LFIFYLFIFTFMSHKSVLCTFILFIILCLVVYLFVQLIQARRTRNAAANSTNHKQQKKESTQN